MEIKTRITLDWHLGIPDGEEKYQKIFDFTDESELQKEYAMQTVKESHIGRKYPVEDLYAVADYGDLEIRYKEDGSYDERAAKATVEHFLKMGNTYFKLEEAYL